MKPHSHNSNCPPRRRTRAFTLIEVLVTMLLLAILLPVIADGLSISAAAASSARRQTEAAGLAQDELNQLLTSGDWSSVTSGDFGSDHPGYRWSCQNAVGDNGVTQIMLNVTWDERGRPRQFALSTMINTNTSDASTSSSTSTGGLP
jgi:prepilin-type N-terminal cleavage/methylation domain-containing protein